MTALLTIATLVLMLLSISIGSESVKLLDALSDLMAGEPTVAAVIVQEIRLPRVLVAVIAGASLGVSGAAMQGLLRNPLASPGLVGSAGGAALGAVAVLYFGLASSHSQWVPIAGMTGSLLATFLVYTLAGREASVTTLILAGVAINATATAGLSLLLNLAPSPFAAQELVLWMLGDLTDRSMADVQLMLPFSVLGWLLLIGTGRALNALTLGERAASSLGVSIRRLRWQVFVAVSLCVGAAIATTGMIGFIGLVVPHLLRPWVGHEPARLLPVSAIGGAAMLLAADIGVRLIPTSVPLKVGVLTSLVGAPFFLHLILRSRREFGQ